MFEDFLVSSDTAAVLSFIAFLILLFIGSNNKNIGIFHSVFNVYQYLKNRKIEYLKNQLASPVVEEEDKKTYQNELSVVTLQKELNLNEKDLQKLRCIKRKTDSEFAARFYKNCSLLLAFDYVTNQFKLAKPIDPKRAKQLEKIGVCLFFTSGLFAYGFLLYMLYIYDMPLHKTRDIVAWAGINYFLMFAIVFIGTRILKFFMKQSNALRFIELSERNLDIQLKQNQISKAEER